MHWTRGQLTAFVDGLVGVVATVIVHVTLPALWDAAAVPALELSGSAGPAGAVSGILVWSVAAVVLPVALPGLRDAALIGTLPLMRLTLMRGWSAEAEEDAFLNTWQQFNQKQISE